MFSQYMLAAKSLKTQLDIKANTTFHTQGTALNYEDGCLLGCSAM
jgi:hypothetical protein